MAVAGVAVFGRAGASPIVPATASVAADVAGVLPNPSAASPRAALGVPYHHVREEGTDGLMGGIPFGLPADTPLVRLERVNRFTIDDVSVGWSSGPGMRPSYATDPRAR